MLNALIGKKIDQSQAFNSSGERIPVTNILAGPCWVIDINNAKRNGYESIQLGFGQKKTNSLGKTQLGIFKKAGLDKNPPRFLREIKPTSDIDLSQIKPGQTFKVADVFKEGDLVSVTGVSKGKGFAGVVKRHHFKGGPRTHGQSDRERAPGSIGQTTTPGRVYKGKRMAGRMGHNKVTIKNLKVIKVDSDKNMLTISGLVAGGRNSLLIVRKIV